MDLEEQIMELRKEIAVLRDQVLALEKFNATLSRKNQSTKSKPNEDDDDDDRDVCFRCGEYVDVGKPHECY